MALPAFAADPAEPAGLPTIAERGPQASPEDLLNFAALNPPAAAEAQESRSANVTINLINRLVERGVLTKKDSTDLIKLAEDDAAVARMQAAATQHDLANARETTRALAAQVAPPPTGDAVRVTYIPEAVKAQMREQIKAEVLNQARDENWAAPRLLPDWVTRIRLKTDIRVRYEGLYYPDGNDNTGAFPNFNAINTGSPFDVSGTIFSPQLNVDQDRQRTRLRARFGLEADLAEGFSLGFRIATGENNSPTTTNQSLGLANQGQGGNFSKYAIWLDRGYLKYEWGGLPEKSLSISVGRFDNPFFDTSVVWDEDVGFDGIALQGRYEVFKGVKPFITLGAFPVFNTDLNFASNRPSKFESDDKWLYGGQFGFDFKVNKDISVKLAGAYYYFDNISGKLSDPYTPLNSQDAGNTDNTRPAFAQKGNTYMALRNIVPNADNNFGTTNQFQYFGLATPFEVMALTGRIDFKHFEPFVISLVGEYVQNLAFDGQDIDAKAVNNRGPNNALGGVGAFDGGDTAWLVDLKVGNAALEKRWDWNLSLGYRHIESDAVVDGFTDSDFANGGTNVKGYTIGGNLALSSRVWLGVRWMSADEIAGPPQKNDIFQIDLNGKF